MQVAQAEALVQQIQEAAEQDIAAAQALTEEAQQEAQHNLTVWGGRRSVTLAATVPETRAVTLPLIPPSSEAQLLLLSLSLSLCFFSLLSF